MLTMLGNATTQQRDKLEAVAVDFGASAAFSMALRLGLWPSRDDVERWCPTWCQRRAGSSARLDSSRLAHESMVIGKWEALNARGRVEELEPAGVAAEAALASRSAAEREAWVAARVEELERQAATAARAHVEGLARREYVSRGGK